MEKNEFGCKSGFGIDSEDCGYFDIDLLIVSRRNEIVFVSNKSKFVILQKV